MNIAVLIKSVIATDEPISVRNGKIENSGVKKVINPYDEYGLEAALRMKEADGGTVTVLSAGDEKTAETLRVALAMGADEAVWIRTVGEPDERVLSLLLAQAIRQGEYELVWAGHLSVDNGAGQVAIRVAELLGWPHAGAIVDCRAEGGALHVIRDAEGDSESWELALPALLTAQQGLNEPRYPALAGIMKAKRKPLAELTPKELLAGEEASARTERVGCEAPPDRPEGRKLGGTVKEQAAELIALLRNEAQVLKAR
ncbi:electron transfer flavoprotein subunit beta/FixA family protein [Cohnella mopanensis]|uniref:electron transfer flavoprotein subunit beta/FixA family protein n=1 Tax=Cohnella mopanensis TaxID=2911966 RepID=UPI001EF94BCA|nr:electron transfer flavoprotein subunit beta/FixA family protein [Cohnella mopanensis]